ncbi:hypothetical protein ACA910_019810 [Epithemia clementina (nom. ined.)]
MPTNGQKGKKKKVVISEGAEDRKMHLPSWMDENNDVKFSFSDEGEESQEKQSLLFGTGNLSLQDRDQESTQNYGATSSSEGKEINADDNDDVESPEVSSSSEKKVAQSEKNITKTKPTPKAGARGAPPNSANDGDDAFGPTDNEDSSSGRPHMPNQNPCLWIFHFINGAAILAALSLLMTQMIPLISDPHRQIYTFFSVLNFILKGYISLFCILFVLVEADVPISTLRNSALLQAYFSRGFLYSFLGLVCTVEASSDRVQSLLSDVSSGQITWAAIFMQVSAWVMCAVGLVYMLMGVCCLKGVRDRMREAEKEAWRRYREEIRAWRATRA